MWSVCEAFSRADAIDDWLAVVLAELAEGGAAPGLALGALSADETVAELARAVRSAEKNVLMHGKAFRVKHFLQLVHSVLDGVHVLDR